MKTFLDKDFLLQQDIAKELYHDYAKDMPIYDYHCHLNPKEIQEDQVYENITEMWLAGDHYKWRIMRSHGISEDLITGKASDYDKFKAFVSVMPKCIGNPMYHWCHLELQRYFDTNLLIKETNAQALWSHCNAVIKEKELSPRKLIKMSNVKVICTTDDPIDNLAYHQMIKEDKSLETKVLPTFRPDKSFHIDRDYFSDYIKELGKVAGFSIHSYGELLVSLKERITFFNNIGCGIADISIENMFFKQGDMEDIELIFTKALQGLELTREEVEQYKTRLFIDLGSLFSKFDWAMQLHIGAMRNNNSPKYAKLGADTGFDSVNDENIAYKLSRLLDALETIGSCPKTILYSLNPKDNTVLGTMIGNFQQGLPGKLQLGAAWWFNDHKVGMEKQLEDLGSLGILGNFVGMLTDSRSFLSYARHEYFRRILCDKVGEWVANGEYPYDLEELKKLIQDICYNNADRYFNL